MPDYLFPWDSPLYWLSGIMKWTLVHYEPGGVYPLFIDDSLVVWKKPDITPEQGWNNSELNMVEAALVPPTSLPDTSSASAYQ
jgi:hypothetical protein